MKIMIFVSTGRCGTRRLYEILCENLSDDFAVVHQMRFSRIANVIGNLLYYLGNGDKMRSLLYRNISSRYKNRRYFISTDPLTSMIIPNDYVNSQEACIIHVIRDSEQFAKSIYSLSRSRIQSFFAHNLVPLWQPGLWPFENLLNRNVLRKYSKIDKLKNSFFQNRYSMNPNYVKLQMKELFSPGVLEELINAFFGHKIYIAESDLKIKSNESRR